MKRIALSIAIVLMAATGKVWAAAFGGTNPDPFDSQSISIHKVFININAAVLTSGSAVILDTSDANLTTGAQKGSANNVGAHINTTTVTNSRRFIGIISQDSCAVNGVCDVVVWGPALARVACSTSNPTSVGEGTQVGTTTVAGQLGAGTRAGLLLSNDVTGAGNGPGVDNCLKWVFVLPQAQ